MIFGLNFNGTPIPPGWARRFRKQLKLDLPRGSWYRLVGVATDNKSLNWMIIQADNGRRKLHVETRKSAAGLCYGVYAY